MITNFFKMVPQDVKLIYNHFKTSQNGNQNQQDRVTAAVVRVLAALGMGLSGVTGLRAFSASTLLGTLSKLTLSVSAYAIFHDLFVISLNSQKESLAEYAFKGKEFLQDIRDLWNGNKNFDHFPRFPLFKGTLLKPIWNIAVTRTQVEE